VDRRGVLQYVDRTEAVAGSRERRGERVGVAHVGGERGGGDAFVAWFGDALERRENGAECLQRNPRRPRAVLGHRGVTVSRLNLREQRLALLQTAFLGALLMGLAVVQALSHHVPAPGYLHAPLIAFFSVLALGATSG
jgi:hypothetical protein